VRRESSLTLRELGVSTLLAEGGRPRAIAASLVISEKTVSSHVRRVLVKLGVNSRMQPWRLPTGKVCSIRRP
jgi:DNA-binding NarL/FixJ family response regulator